MSADYNNTDRRVKTVEEAVWLLKELALKAGVRVEDDLDTSLTKLRAKLESPGQPTCGQGDIDQSLDTLNALIRKTRKEQ
jgi:hypothetical protein